MTQYPVMPWYPDTALADTSKLTLEEHGAYRLLLDHMWLSGGYLDNDDAELAYLLRITKRKWLKIKQKLNVFFTFSEQKMTQKRLLSELEKIKKRQEIYRKNAEKRWNEDKESPEIKENDDAIASDFHMQKEVGVDSGLHIHARDTISNSTKKKKGKKKKAEGENANSSAAIDLSLPEKILLQELGGDNSNHREFLAFLKHASKAQPTLFKDWFSHLRFLAKDDHMLILTMPSEFERNWIQQRHESLLKELYQRIDPNIQSICIEVRREQ